MGILMNRAALLIASAALLVACGKTESTSPTQAEADPEATNPVIAPAPAAAADGITKEQAALTLATLEAPYNTADLANGERVFVTCRSCHTLPEGGARLTGPNLWGVFGRPIGSKEGYVYSQAVQDADFTWDFAKLDRWLDNPKEFLPGNKMTFAGQHDPEDRRDLIAFVATHSQTPPGG
ncbi:MAG: cytochrome c family protein [Sphingomicrobium sp.]